MSLDSYGIHLFNLLYIRYYGIILMAGALAAAVLAERQARKAGLDPERVWDWHDPQFLRGLNLR